MRREGGPLTVLALAQAATTYEFTVAFVALPAIVADLGVVPALVPWVPGAYAVVFGGALPAGGRIVDRYGTRRVLRVALLGLTATTAVVALAPSPAVLLAGRAGQGLAAAVLQPAVLGAMTRVADGAARARAWSVWSAVGAGGLALGAAGGGVLVGLDWRVAIGVVVPVCLAAAWCGRVLPLDDGAPPSVPGPGARVPVLAAAITTTAGVTVAATITLGGALGWTAPPTLSVAALATAAAAGAVVVERSSDPLLGPDLRRRRDVRLGALLAAAYMAGPGALYFLLTARVSRAASLTSDVSGAASLTSPATVGLRLVPLTLGVVVGSAVAGRVVVRVGEARGAAVGFGVAALGTTGTALGPFVVSSLVAGLGSGLAFAAVFALAGRDVPPGRRGAAGGVIAAAQYLASAVALAAYGVLAGPVGYRSVLLLSGAVALAGGVAAWAAGRVGVLRR
ncbi:MFS transporter [Actinomycetospora endophytica]|uniref:MFS transporter n=1 Tax=Actinomycetospora endophytica TaxID=2291215 RepID=A0ABS8P7W2_9PSEU|nr:MFS transporter [Actinomycetospora endophytica]MCD2194335.1 MFS transporter [Actinomycetospora endophytica]